jgi:hypothetical protein
MIGTLDYELHQMVPIIESGVRQEGQQDHGRKQVRQRLFAMAEVVFEVIPLGFERVLRYRRTTSCPFVVTARRGSRRHCGRSQRPIRTGSCATRPCRSTGSWRVVEHPRAIPRVAIQIVAQISDASRRIVRAPLVKPATGGGQRNHLFLANLVVAGKLMHTQKRGGIISALLLLHLAVEERRALGEDIEKADNAASAMR